MENEKKPSNNKNITLFIGFTIALALINGVLVYNLMQGQKQIAQKDVVIEQKNVEINTTSAKLDSIAQQLDIRIAQAKEKDKDYEDLIEIKKELEQDKKNLLASKGNTDVLLAQYQAKIKSYEAQLATKDQEIALWKGTADNLTKEVAKEKQEKTVLRDSMGNIRREKADLEATVNRASILKSSSIRVDAVSDVGKIRTQLEYKTGFKAKLVDKILVICRLLPNEAAKATNKKAYLRVIEASGAVMVSANGGRFSDSSGNDVNYTTSQSFSFDNTQQEIRFEYKKGAEYSKGTYNLEVYCEGYLTGKGNFIIR